MWFQLDNATVVTCLNYQGGAQDPVATREIWILTQAELCVLILFTLIVSGSDNWWTGSYIPKLQNSDSLAHLHVDLVVSRCRNPLAIAVGAPVNP